METFWDIYEEIMRGLRQKLTKNGWKYYGINKRVVRWAEAETDGVRFTTLRGSE